MLEQAKVDAVTKYIQYFNLDKIRSDTDLAAAKKVLSPLNDLLIIAKDAQAKKQAELDTVIKDVAALKAMKDMARPAVVLPVEAEIKAGYATLLAEVTD